MVNKLSISESTKRDITSKLIQKATAQEDITEHNLKRMITFSYDIDRMSLEELYASLRKITENPQQPFSFLANISNEIADNQSSIKTEKSTEIDVREILSLFSYKNYFQSSFIFYSFISKLIN